MISFWDQSTSRIHIVTAIRPRDLPAIGMTLDLHPVRGDPENVLRRARLPCACSSLAPRRRGQRSGKQPGRAILRLRLASGSVSDYLQNARIALTTKLFLTRNRQYSQYLAPLTVGRPAPERFVDVELGIPATTAQSRRVEGEV
jgi:hypothetical protein